MCDDHSEKDCQCTSNPHYRSLHQTLDELDFSRGIWTFALDGCYDEVLNCLDKKGVHPDCLDSSGYTALHYASRNGHTDICRLLMDKGASPNIQTKSGGVTPLHRAAYCGHNDIVRLLLQRGADTTICDEDGKLPLHKAAEKGNKGITELLLQAAPNSKASRDKHGRTPADCVPSCQGDLKDLLKV
ncbi:ankyrin repeat domain-containing protein 39-like [Dreissena polymorpha]|uniref:Ankyrin repeat domain-containing protein 39 n=1 Tax=Dreissena polymorpha TaxID=45954 RepID=A0A9D4GDR9_DREPO|nr:ankyrin repeat domain-containing protein 39-like [Dreissena polymorpha]KAH3813581.1 hypothetical protein DPMN_142042 [Dreissena polymorpha]